MGLPRGGWGPPLCPDISLIFSKFPTVCVAALSAQNQERALNTSKIPSGGDPGSKGTRQAEVWTLLSGTMTRRGGPGSSCGHVTPRTVMAWDGCGGEDPRRAHTWRSALCPGAELLPPSLLSPEDAAPAQSTAPTPRQHEDQSVQSKSFSTRKMDGAPALLGWQKAARGLLRPGPAQPGMKGSRAVPASSWAAAGRAVRPQHLFMELTCEYRSYFRW